MADDERRALQALLAGFDRTKIVGDGGVDVFRACRDAAARAEVQRRGFSGR